MSIRVKRRGNAGKVKPITEGVSFDEDGNLVGDFSLFPLDGIAVDHRGNLYTLLPGAGLDFFSHQLVRLRADGSDLQVLADSSDGLDFPASLSFGTTRHTRKTLFITNFSYDYYTLYRNTGRGFFVDQAYSSGLGNSTYHSLGFGAVFFDADNDGDLDIHVANGHIYPQVDERRFKTTYAQTNQLFENVGETPGCELIDEPALVEALESGHVGGAGLDVFDTEPLPDESPLWRMSNVIVTPHSSGTSPGNFHRASELFVENVQRYVRGEAMRNEVR